MPTIINIHLLLAACEYNNKYLRTCDTRDSIFTPREACELQRFCSAIPLSERTNPQSEMTERQPRQGRQSRMSRRSTVDFRQTGDKVDSRLCRRFWRLSTLSPVCTGLKSTLLRKGPVVGTKAIAIAGTGENCTNL